MPKRTTSRPGTSAPRNPGEQRIITRQVGGGVDPAAFQRSLVQGKIEELKSGLPHLYGWKWYKWAREFYESREKINLLIAGNQATKSSSQIRKNIEWACNKKLWPSLWPVFHHNVRQFWYFYPSLEVATIEFEKKWVPDFMPRGEMKNHEQYGWEAEYDGGEIQAIHFRSGVSLYFKTYGQKASNLQTSTVHMMSCFVAGTLVITARGIVPIEEVAVGDMVLTASGFNRVKNTIRTTSSPVSTIAFSNGQRITATDNHPFFTVNRGWVAFKDLTIDDDIATYPAWKRIKKLFCFLGSYSHASQSTQTIENGSIFAQEINTCMSLCGKPTINERSLKVTLSTTLISILSIIVSKIWLCSAALSIQGYTKRRSGKEPLLKNSSATDAGLSSSLARQSERYQGSVLITVGRWAFGAIAWLARLGSKHEKVRRSDSAPSFVQTEISAVYNLAVENDPTYFADGFLVHNCDEEAPEELVDEMMSRVSAVDGYFNKVFTATMGLQLWYRAMECIGKPEEAFKQARKWIVTLYDCQFYEDGTPGHWPLARIKAREAACTTHNEVLRRVYGRFVKDEGRKYSSFSMENVKVGGPLPFDWKVYGGVDVGSGGKGRSSAAILFVAVNPECTKGRVFRSWRGDGLETAATDILVKFREMRQGLTLVQACYDYQSREFALIAARSGEPFQPADKARTAGETTVNALFKTGALSIDADVGDNGKLVTELMSLPSGEKNRRFQDDLADTLRYVIALIPWDFAKIGIVGETPAAEDDENAPFVEEGDYKALPVHLSKEEQYAWEIRQRRGDKKGTGPAAEGWEEYYQDIADYNEAYGNE